MDDIMNYLFVCLNGAPLDAITVDTWVVFIRYQTEENTMKQGGTTVPELMRNPRFGFPLKNYLL
jgi:hypothetical protein